MSPPEILKTRREQRKLSLPTVQKETRISLTYLEAMESGRWEVFPAEVYLFGFLRKYASYLGLNPEELVSLYKKEMEESHAAELSKKESDVQIKKREQVRQQTQIIFLGCLLIFLGSWWIFTILQTPAEQGEKKVASRREKLSRFAILREDLMELKIEAIETTWLRIAEEKGLLYEGFLPVGAVRSFNGRKYFLIRAEKVSSLKTTLNNVPIDLNTLKRKNHDIFIDRKTASAIADSPPLSAPSDSLSGE